MLRAKLDAVAPASDSHSPPSIAVLPFVNISSDKEQEYFSDGLTEELLNLLAQIPQLRVIARISSFTFKGKNVDIAEIARKLSVSNVLEGSVRKSGATLRITAQLIHAADSSHLWSATYDRQLTDVFKVQDEIAGAVVAALRVKLLPAQEAARPPANAINPEAYSKYLEGRHEFAPRTDAGEQKALELFKQVTALQPDFAEGFAALGSAYIGVAENHSDRKDLMPAAETALARALALNPNSLSALAAHLDLALHKLDWTTASADARRMQAINANGATVLHEMFRYYQLMGFPELALAATQEATKLDPLSFVDHLNVGAALSHIGRFAEAVSAAKNALALVPDQPFVLGMLCTALAHTGRPAEARAIGAKLTAAQAQSDALGCDFDVAVGEGRLSDARLLMDKAAGGYPGSGYSAVDLGDGYATAGDSEDALKWLTRALELKKFTLFTIPYDKSIPPSFFKTPGWKSLSAAPLFVEWRQAHDRLATELAAGKQPP